MRWNRLRFDVQKLRDSSTGNAPPHHGDTQVQGRKVALCNDVNWIWLAENTDTCADGHEHSTSKGSPQRNHQFLRACLVPWTRSVEKCPCFALSCDQPCSSLPADCRSARCAAEWQTGPLAPEESVVPVCAGYTATICHTETKLKISLMKQH